MQYIKYIIFFFSPIFRCFFTWGRKTTARGQSIITIFDFPLCPINAISIFPAIKMRKPVKSSSPNMTEERREAFEMMNVARKQFFFPKCDQVIGINIDSLLLYVEENALPFLVKGIIVHNMQNNHLAITFPCIYALFSPSFNKSKNSVAARTRGSHQAHAGKRASVFTESPEAGCGMYLRVHCCVEV